MSVYMNYVNTFFLESKCNIISFEEEKKTSTGKPSEIILSV